MAAAIVRNQVNDAINRMDTTNPLQHYVWWNGVLIAICSTAAEANAAAAVHPA
jgi:hypothetical protein